VGWVFVVGLILGLSHKITPTYSLDHRNYQRTTCPFGLRAPNL
jgi:hypothetical protein